VIDFAVCYALKTDLRGKNAPNAVITVFPLEMQAALHSRQTQARVPLFFQWEAPPPPAICFTGRLIAIRFLKAA
jgi:hypothetical protein